MEDGIKSETESFAEVSESDLIALALSPNGDEANEHRLGSMDSDLTLNSVSLVDADGIPGSFFQIFEYHFGINANSNF